MTVSLFASARLFINLYIFHFVCLLIWMFCSSFCPSVCLSVRLSHCMLCRLSICLSVHQPVNYSYFKYLSCFYAPFHICMSAACHPFSMKLTQIFLSFHLNPTDFIIRCLQKYLITYTFVSFLIFSSILAFYRTSRDSEHWWSKSKK